MGSVSGTTNSAGMIDTGLLSSDVMIVAAYIATGSPRTGYYCVPYHDPSTLKWGITCMYSSNSSVLYHSNASVKVNYIYYEI